MRLPAYFTWQVAARLRRTVVVLFILFTTLVASSYMADVLPRRGSEELEIAIVVVFGALFAWISIGFWEAMGGLFTVLRRKDPFAITKDAAGSLRIEGASGRTALVMPICNENVEQIAAGVRTIYRSLENTGQLEFFDFFILSDTTDADIWVAEEVAWAEMCRTLGAYNRIYYRHRVMNVGRKSGNIADFCRRWGGSYRYMVVLDADSVMGGEAVVRLVQMMEKRPKVGIIQSSPQAVNAESLIARTQQFSNHAYGPVFTAGLHFLQLGDSHSWGHNAIIRIEPFMKHCALPTLPGKPPLGGEILSHDFVEAALMRKAGYEVWLAYDLGGSYEEIPSTLLDELKRDRRWCQGNLQHIRLLFTKGLFAAHRALFIHGAMSYGSALFWFTFLCLSSVQAIVEAFRKPDYFTVDRSLFPAWPVWHPRWALTLVATAAVLLFLPKLVSVLVIIIRDPRARRFGGFIRLVASLIVEVVISSLLAPIRMLFHCKFVLLPLFGRQVEWSAQERGSRGTTWWEGFRFHFGGTMLAVVWAAVLFVYNRSFFWWNLPILGPLLLSIPISVLTSRPGLGRAFRRIGLFLTPEEFDPPEVIRALKVERTPVRQQGFPIPAEWQKGFVRAVADPWANTLHRFIGHTRRKVTPSAGRLYAQLREKALAAGPQKLTPWEKKRLLRDPDTLHQLHQQVWELNDMARAEEWGLS